MIEKLYNSKKQKQNENKKHICDFLFLFLAILNTTPFSILEYKTPPHLLSLQIVMKKEYKINIT